MNRHQRFLSAYKYLYERGIIHAQKDLAAALKSSAANVSTMIRTGNEKVLTNNMLVRMANAFPGTFNVDWLLNGEGEMLINHNSQPTGFVANDAPKEQQQDALAFTAQQLAQLANRLLDSLERIDHKEKQLDALITKLETQQVQLSTLIDRFSAPSPIPDFNFGSSPIMAGLPPIGERFMHQVDMAAEHLTTQDTPETH